MSNKTENKEVNICSTQRRTVTAAIGIAAGAAIAPGKAFASSVLQQSDKGTAKTPPKWSEAEKALRQYAAAPFGRAKLYFALTGRHLHHQPQTTQAAFNLFVDDFEHSTLQSVAVATQELPPTLNTSVKLSNGSQCDSGSIALLEQACGHFVSQAQLHGFYALPGRPAARVRMTVMGAVIDGEHGGFLENPVEYYNPGISSAKLPYFPGRAKPVVAATWNPLVSFWATLFPGTASFIEVALQAAQNTATQLPWLTNWFDNFVAYVQNTSNNTSLTYIIDECVKLFDIDVDWWALADTAKGLAVEVGEVIISNLRNMSGAYVTANYLTGLADYIGIKSGRSRDIINYIASSIIASDPLSEVFEFATLALDYLRRPSQQINQDIQKLALVWDCRNIQAGDTPQTNPALAAILSYLSVNDQILIGQVAAAYTDDSASHPYPPASTSASGRQLSKSGSWSQRFDLAVDNQVSTDGAYGSFYAGQLRIFLAASNDFNGQWTYSVYVRYLGASGYSIGNRAAVGQLWPLLAGDLGVINFVDWIFTYAPGPFTVKGISYNNYYGAYGELQPNAVAVAGVGSAVAEVVYSLASQLATLAPAWSQRLAALPFPQWGVDISQWMPPNVPWLERFFNPLDSANARIELGVTSGFYLSHGWASLSPQQKSAVITIPLMGGALGAALLGYLKYGTGDTLPSNAVTIGAQFGGFAADFLITTQSDLPDSQVLFIVAPWIAILRRSPAQSSGFATYIGQARAQYNAAWSYELFTD